MFFEGFDGRLTLLRERAVDEVPAFGSEGKVLKEMGFCSEGKLLMERSRIVTEHCGLLICLPGRLASILCYPFHGWTYRIGYRQDG